ncbi:MAG: 3-deoxy-manno-octulosonate cytidylyltransferase [Candidatus Hydrogenedentota bacterium]
MANDREILAVIPARFASQRFPGKVIAELAGKPLVVHTYERAMQAECISKAVIATDDLRVLEALEPYDIHVVMTSTDHPSGTDRIAEVARNTTADIIVNVQGDEPMLDPQTIDRAVEVMLADPKLDMATAKHAITNPDDINDPNVVKVVCDKNGMALYFSRSPIPHMRDVSDQAPESHLYWQHIGLYVFRRSFLLDYATMKPTPLEQTEKLEQLRALENGHRIAVVETEFKSIGVDTPGDLERVRQLLENTLNPEESERKSD